MEITSFILGVCTVIVLVMVVGTFVNYMTTKSLKEEINRLNRENENQYNEPFTSQVEPKLTTTPPLSTTQYTYRSRTRR